ncbi:MAG: protein translocase subunit SecF [Chloroflexi bacterium]|nr:protein translocase subunit SecF [Chloroflexota bacterium]
MDFAAKRRWFFLISVVVILPGLVFLLPPIDGLKAGIDFTGGSSLTLQFSTDISQEDLRTEMADLGYTETIVQALGDRTYFVRTKELSDDDKDAILAKVNSALEPSFVAVGLTDVDGRVVMTRPTGTDEFVITADSGERTGVLTVEPPTEEGGFPVTRPSGDLSLALEPGPGPGQDVVAVNAGAPVEGAVVSINGVLVLAFDLVSPSVAKETVRNAFFAVLLAAVGIFLYVWWAFRNVPSPFRYGAAAIVALLHDTAVVIGAFAFLGAVADIEVNLMFMIALLTVIGYSVNDTIVVFDRLRENVLIFPNRTLIDNVNVSISETFSRSLNTSLTLLFTLLALMLFGGSTIREFLLVLVIGVVVGTYSSIAIASQILVAWDMGDFRRLLRRGTA